MSDVVLAFPEGNGAYHRKADGSAPEDGSTMDFSVSGRQEKQPATCIESQTKKEAQHVHLPMFWSLRY